MKAIKLKTCLSSKVTGAHVGNDNGSKALSQDIKSRGLCSCSSVSTVNHQVHINMYKAKHCVLDLLERLLHNPEVFRQLFLGIK